MSEDSDIKKAARKWADSEKFLKDVIRRGNLGDRRQAVDQESADHRRLLEEARKVK